jgi:hypothetical protein
MPETVRANLGGASTIPHGKRLSYYYFDQNSKLIFRKKPELVSSAPETDRTNSGGVSTILPMATYTPNLVCTSQTDDGTAAPHASLPHIMVLPNSPKSSCMTPSLRFHVMHPKLIHKNLLISFGNQKDKIGHASYA